MDTRCNVVHQDPSLLLKLCFLIFHHTSFGARKGCEYFVGTFLQITKMNKPVQMTSYGCTSLAKTLLQTITINRSWINSMRGTTQERTKLRVAPNFENSKKTQACAESTLHTTHHRSPHRNGAPGQRERYKGPSKRWHHGVYTFMATFHRTQCAEDR